MSGNGDGASGLRRALLALVTLGMVGVASELLLLEHYEEFQQWIPLLVLGLGLGSASAVWVRPGRATLLVFRTVMAGFVATGALGVVLHFRGNAEFELEMEPNLGGLDLFWESIRGATPALAPSAMVFLGLLGLLATWRHRHLWGRGS